MPTVLELYAALAAMPVLLDGQPVPVFDLDALPASVQTAHLPCRLLLPLSARGEARAVTPIAFAGAQTRIAWALTDLFLLLPAGQGRGLAEAAPALARYQSAYLDALRAHVPLLGGVTIESATLDPGVFTYPESGASYYGVEAALVLADIR